jgi:hypothetical protein
MLVYATEFYLKHQDGLLDNVKSAIKQWLGKKLGPAFRSMLIIPFSEPFSVTRPETGLNEVSIIGTPDKAEDYCLSINYRHGDSAVSGRAWFTRIGLERSSPDAPMRVTVLLETSEVSPQAGQYLVTPTKPRIVADILNCCEPDDRTPGRLLKILSEDTLDEFRSEIGNTRRRYPIIVVSPDDFTEEPLLDPTELWRLIVGLAQVYVIPEKRLAWRLRDQLPAWYTAWDGSVTVISPERDGKALGRVYRNDEIEGICLDGNKPFERFLFEEITHRSNLPMSRRHISHEWVGRRLIAFKIAQLKEAGRAGGDLEELVKSYEEDRNVARQTAEDLEFKLVEMEESNSQLREKIAELENKVRTQQWHLKNASQTVRQMESGASAEAAPESLSEFVDCVASQLGDCLELAGNAEKSLRKSPYEDLGRAWMAFQLLGTKFHSAFCGQLPMQEAISAMRVEVDGRYAANNSGITAGKCDGYERTHRGKKYTLNKHIQLGTARDPRFCFRIYFEWEPELKRIIILHAGEHLDTTTS